MLPGANPLAATVEDIALLKSPGREKILVEGAKKEGKVTFYTGLIVDQVVRPLKEAFEKDYPFIQLDFFRGNSERVAQKMLLEYQAKRFDVDLISGSGSTTMIQQAGFMQRFFSPQLAEYPTGTQRSQRLLGEQQRLFHDRGLQYAQRPRGRCAEELR